MKQIKYLLIIILLLWASPAVAVQEEPGIHGETSFRYEIEHPEFGQQWTIDLHYTFKNQIALGASITTFTDGSEYSIKGLPSYDPISSLYDIYITVNFKNIEIKLSQWCVHEIASPALESANNWVGGLYIEGKYKF